MTNSALLHLQGLILIRSWLKVSAAYICLVALSGFFDYYVRSFQECWDCKILQPEVNKVELPGCFCAVLTCDLCRSQLY